MLLPVKRDFRESKVTHVQGKGEGEREDLSSDVTSQPLTFILSPCA